MNDLSNKRPLRSKLILATVLGIVAALFGLFFIMANDAWTVVRIPSAPWNPEPSWAAFESPLSAIMTVSFALGGVFTVLVSRVITRDVRRRAREDKQRIDALQREISSVNRLMESSGGAHSIQREQR